MHVPHSQSLASLTHSINVCSSSSIWQCNKLVIVFFVRSHKISLFERVPELKSMDVFLLYSIFFIILSVTLLRNLIKRMSLPKPKLPPGSMGLPYIGETPKLFSQNPDDFFSTRQKRSILCHYLTHTRTHTHIHIHIIFNYYSFDDQMTLLFRDLI